MRTRSSVSHRSPYTLTRTLADTDCDACRHEGLFSRGESPPQHLYSVHRVTHKAHTTRIRPDQTILTRPKTRQKRCIRSLRCSMHAAPVLFSKLLCSEATGGLHWMKKSLERPGPARREGCCRLRREGQTHPSLEAHRSPDALHAGGGLRAASIDHDGQHALANLHATHWGGSGRYAHDAL